MGDRTILHSDMNCFYASVEMLHHPELEGKPLAVGGDPEARHGIVLTANYIAKKCGVKTGMALWQAKQACPEIIFVPPRMDLYLRFSSMAREIYSEYTDKIEPYGIDEGWEHPIRSLGVRGSDLVMEDIPVQLDLFDNQEKREKLERLDRAVDEIRRRFGYFSIQRAAMYQDKVLSHLDAGTHTVHPHSYFHG